ncbi:hypothetical protein [uncultured Methylobacterium sp.]|uniref:hypothetical protein n=1 Tax=uncultured Methylobacterium sp. TaxID=157278 RepID=UPI0035C9C662
MTAHSAFRPRAGSVRVVLFLAGVAAAVLAALPLVTTSAEAQTVESRRDQPTPATLPDSAERQREGDKPVGQVAPPEAITSSTAIVASDRKGKTSYTNPLDHLPARDRSGTGGGRSD